MRSTIALLTLAGTTAAVAQPSFQGLGDLPGGAVSSEAWKVSSDGTAVTGFSESSDGVVPIRWTARDGLVRLRDFACGTGLGEARAISGDGAFVAGHTPNGEGFTWSAADGLVVFGDLPGPTTNAWIDDYSEDGTTVVGVGDWDDNWPTYTGQAFRWTLGGGFDPLGWAEPAHDFSEAIGCNADGSVVVGYSGKALVDWYGFVWIEGSGMQSMGDLEGGAAWSLATDVTADGQVVIGQSSGTAGYMATMWTQAGGLVSIGDLPGGSEYALAWGISDDASVVVGLGDWDGGTGKAFIWREGVGMLALKDVLEGEHGLDLTGWMLESAHDVSADGTVIVGTGTNPSGNPEAWIARLTPTPCPADFNQDGVRNTVDVLAFLNAFNAGCP